MEESSHLLHVVIFKVFTIWFLLKKWKEEVTFVLLGEIIYWIVLIVVRFISVLVLLVWNVLQLILREVLILLTLIEFLVNAFFPLIHSSLLLFKSFPLLRSFPSSSTLQ